MKRGFFLVDSLVSIWMFLIIVMAGACIYGVTVHIMFRHSLRERAAALIEEQLGRGEEAEMSRIEGALRLETSVKLIPPSAKLQSREYMVYYRDEQFPIYNLVSYE